MLKKSIYPKRKSHLPNRVKKQRPKLKTKGQNLKHQSNYILGHISNHHPTLPHQSPHKHHRKYGGDIFFRALPLCVMSPSSVAIHREVFAAVGPFDEELPACEDYELWLRIACRYEVEYLAEQLIRKYGGHDDQLSQAHYAMDRFRVYALDKLLREVPALSPERREVAQAMLVRKARIVHKGAIKRGNLKLQVSMRQYMDRWQ